MENFDQGIVKKIVSANRAEVLVVSTGECSACASKESCQMLKKKNSIITALYEGELAEGDRVKIIVSPGNRVAAAVILFLIPLLFLFAGYLISFKVTKSENIAIGSAFGAFGFSFLIIYYLTKKLPFLNKLSCRLEKIQE